MSPVTKIDEESLETLQSRVAELRAGDYGVRDVSIDVGLDGEANEAVFLTVTLEDPSEETWPVDDILELHRGIDDIAIELGLPVRWYVATQGATPTLFDPEDLVADAED